MQGLPSLPSLVGSALSPVTPERSNKNSGLPDHARTAQHGLWVFTRLQAGTRVQGRLEQQGRHTEVQSLCLASLLTRAAALLSGHTRPTATYESCCTVCLQPCQLRVRGRMQSIRGPALLLPVYVQVCRLLALSLSGLCLLSASNFVLP